MDLYNKNYNSVMTNCCKIDEMNLFVQHASLKRTMVYTRHLVDYPYRNCPLDQSYDFQSTLEQYKTWRKAWLNHTLSNAPNSC